jgi:hypothetical protein
LRKDHYENLITSYRDRWLRTVCAHGLGAGNIRARGAGEEHGRGQANVPDAREHEGNAETDGETPGDN